MLDGSEQGLISFTDFGLQFQSVDSIGVCMCLFRFPARKFFRYDLEQDRQVKFKLRPLYNFVKKFHSTSMAFTCNNNRITLAVTSNFDKGTSKQNLYHIDNTHDNTVYYALPSSILDDSACFRLNPEEFTNIVLDLAVGGGYINVSMQGTRTEFKTIFETGTIVTSCNPNPDRQEYEIIRPAVGSICNTYLTKFFKQASNLSSSCRQLCIYIHKDGPIVLQFDMNKELCQIFISIAPVNK